MNLSRPIVVLDAAIPFLEEVLTPYAEVRRVVGAAIAASDVRDADALVVRTRTRCDARLLAGSRVRLVVTATIGSDHIDHAWCAAAGIRVETAAGCNARGVLQWVAAVLACLAREEGWNPSERTLGVVGVGHVGSLVKDYAEAWGFRVLCCDPPREERERLGFLSLQEVASEADLLTFHTPLDASTYHLCDEELLGAMKPTAVVLNAARGGVVDERALLARRQPCVLDVWEGEPQLNGAMLAHARLATPHVAGYSAQGKANASAIAVHLLSEHFGWPLAGWYPPQVQRPAPRPIGWGELLASIDDFYPILAESARLKQLPDRFEELRDNYRYRLEYF